MVFYSKALSVFRIVFMLKAPLWNPEGNFKIILPVCVSHTNLHFYPADLPFRHEYLNIYPITLLCWIPYCLEDFYFRNQVKLVPWNAQKCIWKQKWMNILPNDYVNLQFSVTQTFMVTIFNTVLSVLFNIFLFFNSPSPNNLHTSCLESLN